MPESTATKAASYTTSWDTIQMHGPGIGPDLLSIRIRRIGQEQGERLGDHALALGGALHALRACSPWRASGKASIPGR